VSTIIVIGAGLSGLSAARALHDCGHRVVVVDKAREPGGRACTRRVVDDEADRPEFASLAFDHGAQYFTARDRRFEREVERWHRARVAQVWHGRLATFDSEGREAVEDGVMRWVGVPGMSAIPRHLARGLDLRCGQAVNALVRQPGESPGGGGVEAPGTTWAWRTAMADGTTMGPFDAAIVAVPAPQAAPLVAGSAPLAAEVANVRMYPCWAVLVAFEDRVPAPFDGAFVASSPLGWIARDRSKPQRGFAETWVLHASAAWSAAHVDDRADAAGPFLLNAFRDLVRGPLPRPVHVSAHRWRWACADPPLARGALIDSERRIAVCGDWCAGNRIEAAWLSGLEAAESIDQCDLSHPGPRRRDADPA
jgi:predicted NAD/FAD-dependent oxidoreductase